MKQTAKEGVFQSVVTSSNEPAHFYTIKDDKLVELKDVKSIDKDGKCTMADGTIKTLEQVKADAVEVSAQDIIDYNNTLKQVHLLNASSSLAVQFFIVQKANKKMVIDSILSLKIIS